MPLCAIDLFIVNAAAFEILWQWTSDKGIIQLAERSITRGICEAYLTYHLGYLCPT